MKKGKLKLPRDPRRKAQVRTFVQRYGRKGYQIAGAKGGGAKSSGSFTSERAREASLVSWEKRRARQRAEQEIRDNENGLSTNEEN